MGSSWVKRPDAGSYPQIAPYGRAYLPVRFGRSILLPMITVYLDACCLNRPFDDQTQDRIRLEAEAVLLILGHVHRGEWRWIGSEVLHLEIAQNPDAERRRRTQVLVGSATESISLDETIERRGNELEALGFGAFDALHLACAEQAQADVFLTTDDGLLRRARRFTDRIQVPVENPLTWLNRRSDS
jgi:predicted nucleic acid-binding protein